MLARSALIVSGALVLAYAALPAPRQMALADRLAVLAASGCTTDTVCELRAAELGIDPRRAGMPADALTAECIAGDAAACAYLEAQHRAACADDMQHDDCAVFRPN